MKFLTRILTAALSAVILVSAALVPAYAADEMSDGDADFPPVIPAKSFYLGSPARYLLIGDTYQISPAALPVGSVLRGAAYESDNPEAVAVTADGEVTGLSQGMAQITVSADGGLSQTTDFHVIPTMVDINAVAVPMKPGGTFRIRATVSSWNGEKVARTTKDTGVKYSSSNESVATVSDAGVITGVADGRARVTVTTKDGGHSRYLWVEVDSRITASGVDISRWQGELSVSDWEAVKADGFTFAILKIGYGRERDQIDLHFEHNYATARQAGIDLGVYHFSYAETPEQAEAEADAMLDWLAGRQFELGVYYDVEEPRHELLSPEALVELIDAYSRKLEASGYRVGIYSYASFLQHNLPRSSLAGRSVWLANTKTLEPNRVYTGPFSLWQYCHSGRVSGINENVDLNVMY